MPGRFFTEAERHRLNHFPEQVSDEECSRYGTITPEDVAKLGTLRGEQNRLGFAVQVGALRWLGYVPDTLLEAPANFVAFIAQQLGVAPTLLAQYGQRAHTRTDHMKRILKYLHWSHPSARALKRLRQWLVARALEHDSPAVLFTLAAERLRAQRLVRPGVTVVERLVATARDAAHAATFRRLKSILTPKLCGQLDQMLLFDPEVEMTRLGWLRQKATTHTPDGINTTIARIAYMQRLGAATWDLSRLSANRIKWLTAVAKRATNQTLQRMGPERRYPALVAFLRGMLEEQTDVAVQLVDGCLWSTKGRSEQEVEAESQRQPKTTASYAQYFTIMGTTLLDQQIDDTKVRTAVFEQIPREALAAALAAQNAVPQPPGAAEIERFTKRFNYVRQFSPTYLATLRFHAHPEASAIIEAMALVRRKAATLPTDAPMGFVTKPWRPFVQHADPDVARHAYELCMLMALREAIRGGRVWVEHSREYAEPGSYLMPEQQWKQKRAEVCALTQTAMDGKLQLQMRQADLESVLAHLDSTLPTDLVRIDEGKLIVRPLPPAIQPEHLARCQHLIGESLPQVELADIVMEVNDELRWTEVLTHASGSTSRIPDLTIYLVAAILAQACNFGLKQMAQMADLSYDTLIWVTEWYLREDNLKAANAIIVNAHYRLPLSQQWGTGALSSSDGHRLPVMGHARNARAISRYFLHEGITHYTWTSDQMSQYGAKVTVSSERDAPYVLDEILDNITDLPIAEHTTDTAGFTELVFCFFDLLGLRFSPRIKNISTQILYRMDSKQQYEAIEPLLKGKIKPKRIFRHYDELLRIMGSLKYGYASASLLLKKLQTSIATNPLAQAAQEYGRLCKSIQIVRMLVSEEYRHYVHRQLNKGENVNGLRQFILCANEGVVRKHQPEEHLQQALCLTLVTNAVIYWNTRYMQEAVTQLRAQGVTLSDADLSHIYPTHFAHINRYGKLVFHPGDPTQPHQRRPLRDALHPRTFTPPSDEDTARRTERATGEGEES